MAWYDEDSWATALFAPTPQMIGITLLVAILLPILIHTLLYKSVAKAAQTPKCTASEVNPADRTVVG